MSDFSKITTAILAGGLGTRLRSVISDRPKVLADVGGRPFLTYLLDQLRAVGAARVVLCTGYLGEQIQSVLGDRYKEIELIYSQESSPQGTAGALRLALPLLGSGSVLVMNGDSFCQANLKALATVHRIRPAKATLLLVNVLDTSRFGRVEIEPEGQITGFVEKQKEGGPGWINAGIYLLEPPFLESISSAPNGSLERDVFPAWIGRGMFGYRSPGRFLDIGTPESYAEAQDFFAQEKFL
jgi:D-glycero-alpha-D-manno-heptose 1-phosphate guanylyltransferase